MPEDSARLQRLEQMATEAALRSQEAAREAMEAKAIALAHQAGCERAYKENERRLTSIETKTDEQTRTLGAIQDLNARRYWATLATMVTVGITVGWQVFIWFHPHI